MSENHFIKIIRIQLALTLKYIGNLKYEYKRIF